MNEKIFKNYRLAEKLNQLSKIKGDTTEFITLTVPKIKNTIQILNFINSEIANTSSIKSKITKSRVKKALVCLKSHISLHKITAATAYFASKDGVVEIKHESIKNFNYCCKNKFEIQLINLNCHATTGFIILDRRAAAIGVLNGGNWTHFKILQSYIPGKTKKGGQSARRYEQIRQTETHKFFLKIADYCKTLFLKYPKISTIYYGGVTPTKQNFLRERVLPTEISNKIKGNHPVIYINKYGMEELANKVFCDIESSYLGFAKKQIELLKKHEISGRVIAGSKFNNISNLNKKILMVYGHYDLPDHKYYFCKKFNKYAETNCLCCTNPEILKLSNIIAKYATSDTKSYFFGNDPIGRQYIKIFGSKNFSITF